MTSLRGRLLGFGFARGRRLLRLGSGLRLSELSLQHSVLSAQREALGAHCVDLNLSRLLDGELTPQSLDFLA